jgi:hypothetical protein
MKKIMLAALLIGISVPAAAQTVETGRANWTKLPKLETGNRMLDYAPLAAEVERMLKEKQCTLPGQSARRFDITIPYAVLVEPNGQISRVLVSDMQCKPLEALVGEAAIAIAQGVQPGPGAQKALWYASEVNFNLQ